jgi:hypothetical protein
VTRVLLLLVAAAVLSACPREKLKPNGCRQDSDCGTPTAGYRCETQTGECYCRTNEGCPSGQYCNTLGFCQDKAGCEKNADCLGANQFCDTTTGSCLDKGRCSIDLHCALGKVCDTVKGTCVDGCHTSGDCPGSSCRCGDKACACAGTTQAELSKCTVGVCDPNFCADKSFCKFGELCGLPPDAGATLAQCYSDFDPQRRPYCTNCPFGGGTNVCGTGPNFCLIDTAHPGNYFCGVDCSAGQSCPRGYGCDDVITVGTGTTPLCSRTSGCPPNPALTCTQDSECKRGGRCYKESGAAIGKCQAPCLIGESDGIGSCGCQIDSDCAQETCSSGECTITRKKCTGDGDCKTIHCVDFEGVGGCYIGSNCAPTSGLTCLEVQ